MTKSVFTDNYEIFVNLLILARKRAGLTQQDLAKKLGTTQSYISKYEHKDRRLDIVEMIEITKAIGVDPISIINDLNKRWI